MTGGKAIVKSLQLYGIDTLFGIPGVELDQLFVALYDEREAIRVIANRHEQGCAYMAFGYAQSSGRVGAYAVVPGPGLLNSSAALATAYACNAPVLCITGQVPIAADRPWFRRPSRNFGSIGHSAQPDQIRDSHRTPGTGTGRRGESLPIAFQRPQKAGRSRNGAGHHGNESRGRFAQTRDGSRADRTGPRADRPGRCHCWGKPGTRLLQSAAVYSARRRNCFRWPKCCRRR